MIFTTTCLSSRADRRRTHKSLVRVEFSIMSDVGSSCILDPTMLGEIEKFNHKCLVNSLSRSKPLLTIIIVNRHSKIRIPTCKLFQWILRGYCKVEDFPSFNNGVIYCSEDSTQCALLTGNGESQGRARYSEVTWNASQS